MTTLEVKTECSELFWQFMQGEITLAELEGDCLELGTEFPLFDELMEV